MAGTAVAPFARPASPLNVPETERIAALLAEITGGSAPFPGVPVDSSDDVTSTLRVRKPGPRAERAPSDPRLEPVGRELGRRMAEMFPNPGGSTGERFEASLRAAFRHLGWPEPTLDLGRSDENVVIVQVEGVQGDTLVRGMLAALMSQLAGVEFEAAPMPAAGEARLFAVAPPERLDGVRA